MARGGEAVGVADEADQGGGGEQADAGDGAQGGDSGERGGEGGELLLDGAQALLEAGELVEDTLQRRPHSGGQRRVGIGEQRDDGGADLAGADGDGDTELAQQAADGVQARGAGGVRLRLAPPVVGGAAGFHDDGGRRGGGDEAGELRAGEAVAGADAARLGRDGDFKDRLREIDGDGGSAGHRGLLLSAGIECGHASERVAHCTACHERSPFHQCTRRGDLP